MPLKLWAWSALALALTMAPVDAFAQGGKGAAKQDDLPNGRPFQSLQAQIDQLELEQITQEERLLALEAAWQEAKARLAANETSLQLQFEAFQALSAVVFELGAMSDEQAATLGALSQALATGCGLGSSIRQVAATGEITCEFDDLSSGVGRLSAITISSTGVSNVPPFAAAQSVAIGCSSGVALGGGFDADLGLIVYKSRPVSVSQGGQIVSGWQIVVQNQNPFPLTARATARCTTIVP